MKTKKERKERTKERALPFYDVWDIMQKRPGNHYLTHVWEPIQKAMKRPKAYMKKVSAKK